MKIVATLSLPAVDRPNADRWNGVRLCQFNHTLVRIVRCRIGTVNLDPPGCLKCIRGSHFTEYK